jgi:hypothetical protein
MPSAAAVEEDVAGGAAGAQGGLRDGVAVALDFEGSE